MQNRYYLLFAIVVMVLVSGCGGSQSTSNNATPNASSSASSSSSDNSKESAQKKEETAKADTSAKESQPAVQTNTETKKEATQSATAANENGFKPLTIYADKGTRGNHYVPSGFMPDGKCITFDDTWTDKCHSGSTCIKVNYDVACSKAGQKWAGIYWLNPANNWGSQKGGFNLTGAAKLTFWAKGEKGGERIEEVKMGGLTGQFPDSDTAVIGPIILTPEWQQYTIDLRGKDLSSITGGFAWSTNVDVNPEACTFYLDDIQYE